MFETHLGHFHQQIVDSYVSEAKLLYVVVPSVAQPVWRSVATQLAVFMRLLGLLNLLKQLIESWDILQLFPNFP